MEAITPNNSQYTQMLNEAISVGKLYTSGILLKEGDIGHIKGLMWNPTLRVYVYGVEMAYPKIREEDGKFILSVEKFNAHPAKRIDVAIFDSMPKLVMTRKGNLERHSEFYLVP